MSSTAPYACNCALGRRGGAAWTEGGGCDERERAHCLQALGGEHPTPEECWCKARYSCGPGGALPPPHPTPDTWHHTTTTLQLLPPLAHTLGTA